MDIIHLGKIEKIPSNRSLRFTCMDNTRSRPLKTLIYNILCRENSKTDLKDLYHSSPHKNRVEQSIN